MAERSTGTVKWYNSNKGFGFITPDDGGEDLFFHRSTIARDGPQVFFEGEPVEFIVERRDDGRIVAVNADRPNFTFSGGWGHIRRNCPDQPPKPFRGCTCYACGEDGHYAKDCPHGRSVKQMKTVLVEETALSSEEADERELYEIKEREKEYKLRFNMPGMIRNDVKVWVEDKKVVFKAEKAQKTKKAGGVKVEDEEDWPAESYGKYKNRITFPEDVVFEEIKAEVRDGVLYLTVPKAGSKILNINVL